MLTSDEIRWQTESDARIMQHYFEIQKDEARLTAAKDFLENERENIDAALEAFKRG